jgi:hypothetical protein
LRFGEGFEASGLVTRHQEFPMSTVRAKFKVDDIRRHKGNRMVAGPDGKSKWEECEIRTVIFSPVYTNGDPNHENSKFWNATPSGKIELGCANLEAAQHFDLGQEIYVDFTPAA